MTQFIYDGTYAGLLTAIFDIYDRKCADAGIVSENRMEALVFTNNIIVYSDSVKAQRLLTGLKKKVSVTCLNDLYRCYLSEIKGIENTILEFVRYVFKSKIGVESNFGNRYVLAIAQISRKVAREKHRFEAFVRFESIAANFFYAPIDPDYNVLPLILPHFKRRYADQHWIIYDTKRKYGIHYNRDTEQVTEALFDFVADDKELLPSTILFDPDEKLYQDLWKNYFKSVNIPIRKNRKLHLQHVPKRYWKYLVEKRTM